MSDNIGTLGVLDSSDGAIGSAAPTVAIQVGGTDGTNLRSLSTDSTGKLNVNTVSTIPDKSGTGTISALNGTVVATTSGAATVVFNILGTWSATLLFEGQDGNSNWIQVLGTVAGQGSASASTASNNAFIIPCAGFNQVRIRASLYASGTATINYNVGTGLNSNQIFNLVPSALQSTTRLNDGNGNVLTSTLVGSKQSLDSNVTQIATFSDKIGSGSISTLNGTIVATTNGCSIVSFNVTGTWVATIVTEGSIDNGSTWVAIDADVDASDTIINTFTTNSLVTINCSSYNQVRLRASLYTSGTLNVVYSAGIGLSLVEVYNTNAASLQTTSKIQDGSGNIIGSSSNSLNTNTKIALTSSSPAAVSVGVASTAAVASNANRKGLILTNTSTAKISIGIGVSAVLNSGIVLYPGGVWVMDEFNFTIGAINAIASIASSNLATQEFTT